MDIDRKRAERGGLMPDFSYRPVSKESQLYNNRKGKKNQRMRGAISPSVREQVKARSKGLCEVRKRCNGSPGVHMAHLQSRNTIEETTAEMIRHACLACHQWLDTNDEGIKYKRALREGA